MLDVMGGRRSVSGDLVDRIPPNRFGKGKARILRKMVLLAIAANANPDGTGAWPSRETIARRCLVSVRAVANVIDWLVGDKLLKVESKAAPTSKYGRTNLYTIRFPKTRRRERKASEHREMNVHGGQETPGTTEASTRNNSQEDKEQMEIAPGNETSHNRPPLPPVVDRPTTPTTTGAAAVADPSRRKGYKKSNTDQGITPQGLMAEIIRICNGNNMLRLETTEKHRKRAFKMAREHGQDVFLGALHCWLIGEPEETFVVPGGDFFEYKTWLLLEFMNTSALTYIERVRPYAHMDRGEVLRFLLHVQDLTGKPIGITPQQAAMLQGLMTESSFEAFVRAFDMAKDNADFLDHATEYVEKAKDEDFLNTVAKYLGIKPPRQLAEEARAAFVNLARKIGPLVVRDAVLMGAPWDGKPLEKIIRYCEEFAPAETREC